ncbi:MAG TPA: hypothetical protein VG099_14805 [Gemmataceae bacterium]|nr:hypothetical protein [Gemmataceae bacterium]
MLHTLLPLLLLLLLSLCAPALFCRLLRFVERPFRWIGRQRGLCVVVSGLSALVVNVALALLGQIPQPLVHDEFTYLLQADTFAQGRLTNPPHPLWVHFETMHVLQQPTYASKYPPAQGLILALGQVLCGQPIVGVWLSGALASAAICWMLLGCLRPRWAALGGVLAALHPLMIYWNQTYWGGAVAACGGALVCGSAVRIREYPKSWDAMLLGVGLAILANSRPFEGLLLALITLTPVLIDWVRGKGPAFRIAIQKLLLPSGLVMLPVLAWMGYYNGRVTGDPLRMPLLAYAETHDVAPKFLWQSAKSEPVYRHKEMRDLHVGWELPFYEQQQTATGLLMTTSEKLIKLVERYVPVVIFQLPWLTLPWLYANRKTRAPLLQLSLFIAALLVSEVWLLPHYAAPMTGLLMLSTINGLRLLRLWTWQERPAGRCLVRGSVIMSAVLLAGYCVQLSRAQGEGWHMTRARIQAQLSEEPGYHLVLVRYSPEHNTHTEWVYNRADIDDAKIVWARDMGPEQTRALLKHFAKRTVWLLEADASQPILMAHSQVP